MSRTTLKNTKGDISQVTIDIKKHKDIIVLVFEQLGIFSKSKFDNDFEKV